MFEMDEIVTTLVLDGAADWLLTTRPDSDELLALDDMERMRAAVTGRIAHVIDRRPTLA